MAGSLKRGFGISDYAECSQRFDARLKYAHLDAYRGKLRPILPLLETLNGIIHRNIYKMATRKQHESLFGILELTLHNLGQDSNQSKFHPYFFD